jgi:hypothetical protein
MSWSEVTFEMSANCLYQMPLLLLLDPLQFVCIKSTLIITNERFDTPKKRHFQRALSSAKPKRTDQKKKDNYGINSSADLDGKVQSKQTAETTEFGASHSGASPCTGSDFYT